MIAQAVVVLALMVVVLAALLIAAESCQWLLETAEAGSIVRGPGSMIELRETSASGDGVDSSSPKAALNFGAHLKLCGGLMG